MKKESLTPEQWKEVGTICKRIQSLQNELLMLTQPTLTKKEQAPILKLNSVLTDVKCGLEAKMFEQHPVLDVSFMRVFYGSND